MRDNFKPFDRDLPKLRVAVLGLRGFPDIQGGIEKHCQELYPRLVRRKFDITVLVRKGYSPINPYQYEGVKLIPLWAPRMKSFETICHTALGILWLAKHRKDYDILHIHAIGPSLLSCIAKQLGFLLVITHHGPDYERQKWGIFAKKVLQLGERIGAQHADFIIVVSQQIKKLLYEKYTSCPVFIPNGVNIPERIPAGQTLSRFDLEPKRYILAVGRLVPEKGFRDLIEAYAGLSTDWKLAIVGSADHNYSYTNSLIKKANKISGVVMAGFQKGKALAELYSNAGLFVLPSYHEGLPIVALEAISYNLPIILSDISANREVALPEETFKVGNIDSLYTKISEFLENPSKLSNPQIAACKKHRLDFDFNWDVIAKKTEKIYLAVANSLSKTNLEVSETLSKI